MRLGEAIRAWQPAHGRTLPPGEHERVMAGARMERHGGLTALYLCGTPYEMGYQQGTLARELIHGFRQSAYAYVTGQVPVPRAFARPLLFYYASSYWRTLGDEHVREMKGIAHAAGVHAIEALVSTAIWEILLVSGCSEFAAVGPATADGSLLHGYNYDLMHPDHALIQPYLAVLLYRPSQGIPFFTVNTVGTVGANAGMNEAGISVAWDNTHLKDRQLVQGIQLPVVPFILTLRRLLQYATTLDEAVQTITSSLPRPLADIVIIGSAREARAVAVETAGRSHAIRDMDAGTIWSTNCFRSASLAPYDRRGDSRGLPEAEAWQCVPRFTAYSQLFTSARGQITPAMAAAFLRDPYPREAQGFLHPNPASRATICRSITSWSLVMQPGHGRFWVSDTRLPGCQGRFYAFDLHNWAHRPDLDLPASGFHSALAAAQRFRAGDLPGAGSALAEALSVDGPSAPLLLMQALLKGLVGDEEAAAGILEEVQARWAETPAAALARAWSATRAAGVSSLPFPSAIQPLVELRAAEDWPGRAVTYEPAPASEGPAVDARLPVEQP
ncbi:MAG: C45 family peptidase [Anaerolineae bacterium]|nr:C45 family peptidase [Anaerolineae bacterium]